MKLINGIINGEHIQSLRTLSLDELHQIASQFGEVEIGGIFGPASVSINANFTGDDYLQIKYRKYPDLKQNLSEAIDRARRLKSAYDGL